MYSHHVTHIYIHTLIIFFVAGCLRMAMAMFVFLKPKSSEHLGLRFELFPHHFMVILIQLYNKCK